MAFDSKGVADGVGGWREYGIDPSKFSSSLMETCKRLIEKDKLDLNDDKNINSQTPIKILSHSYNTLLENKNGLIGK
jgi:protein phosphatase PTC7